MYNEINAYVSKFHQFSNDELKKFNDLLEFRNVKKKTFLLKPGEIASSEFFIKKGCMRTFYVSQIGAEITLNFGIENWWMADMNSNNGQTPSRIFIETIENCELFALSTENKKKLLLEVPSFDKVFRIMLENHVAAIQHRLILLVTEQARERYLDFIKRYPELPKRVTQLQIATYLGITPEFLSKMKHDMMNENII